MACTVETVMSTTSTITSHSEHRALLGSRGGRAMPGAPWQATGLKDNATAGHQEAWHYDHPAGYDYKWSAD